MFTPDFAHLLITQTAACFAIGFLLPTAWPKHFDRKSR